MINFEWGIEGVKKFSAVSDIIIIVDVLSFSTCVDVVTGNYAYIYPYKYKDGSAAEYARSCGAQLASPVRSLDNISLSPYSLKNVTELSRIVLPSPNGSELSLLSKSRITLCACLRNYRAVAEYANSISSNVTVIAAGEKWPDGSIRFAAEDLIGAGAVISVLEGERTSEAEACSSFFESSRDKLEDLILCCVSGKELIDRGYSADVHLALEIDCSQAIPSLVNGCYINQSNSSLR